MDYGAGKMARWLRVLTALKTKKQQTNKQVWYSAPTVTLVTLGPEDPTPSSGLL